MAAAPDGSVLVADSFHARIERIRPDGRVEVVAGTGERGFSGDGGLASAAALDLGGSTSEPPGIAIAGNGDVLFADVGNRRVRRVRSDGTIDTVAGTGGWPIPGPPGPTGDGGPAVAAPLLWPEDVLAMPDGGFLVSDSMTASVRRVRPDGIIVRLAGIRDPLQGPGSGDGGPALRAGIGTPAGLARSKGGDVLIAETSTHRVRRVARDGTISTLVDLAPETVARVGDFAGRTPTAPLQGLAVTTEGGIVMAAGHVFYRAPRDTVRTLVALRDARVSAREVVVAVDATQAGAVRLQVRRRGRVIASTTARRIRPGRSRLRVMGRFAARMHDLRVTLTGPAGAAARDEVSLLTSSKLPSPADDDGLAQRISDAAGGVVGDTGAIDRCRRQTARRIDCAVIDLDLEDDDCVAVLTFSLRPSGVIFRRPYVCRSRAHPFRLRPAWTEPATALR